MKINLKVRMKNPLFIVQLFMAILTPILAYLGLAVGDMTSWAILGDVFYQALSNPYVLSLVAVSVFNTLTDPTTKGVGDSENALEYTEPK